MPQQQPDPAPDGSARAASGPASASAPAAPRAAPPRPWLRRLAWSAAALATLAGAWTLAAGWWLPRWLPPRLEAAATQALGAPLTLQQLSIEPWTLRARASGLRLGPAEAPWLEVAAIELQLSPASLWQRAAVLDRVRVHEPRLLLERQAPGRYNISPLLEALAARRADAAAGDGPRFVVHDLQLQGGQALLRDRVGGAEHRVSALQFTLPRLSSLPQDAAIDVEPALQALLDDSTLALHGRLQPFAANRVSSVSLRWQRIDLARLHATLAPLLPPDWPLALQRGALDLALQLHFEGREAPALPRLQIAGRATASALQATLPRQGLRLSIGAVEVEDLDLAPLERRVRIGALNLRTPDVDADLPRLLAAAGASRPSAASTAAASEGGAATPGWQWRVDRVVVADGRGTLRHPGWPEPQRLAPVTAQLTGLAAPTGRTAVPGPAGPASSASPAAAAGAPAAMQLTLADSRGATAQLSGEVDLAAGRVALKVELRELQPAPWLAPWSGGWPLRLQAGRLGLQAQVTADAGGWALDDGRVRLDGLQALPVAAATPARRAATPGRRAERAGDRPADRLLVTRAEASGVQLRAATGRPLAANVGSVLIDGLDLGTTRRNDGTLPWLAPATPPRAAGGTGSTADSRTGQRAAAAPRRPAPAGAAPTWQIGELRCRGCAARFDDLAVQPAVAVALTRGDITLRRLRSDLRQPIDFALAATVGNDGRARARGSLRLQPLALRSRLELATLDLAWLQPYLDPYLNLTLESAQLGADGELQLDGSAGATISAARWQGRLALTELRALDRLNAAEFLRFGSLSLNAADVAWQPSGSSADLGMVAIDGFYGRVIVNADGRINLRDIVRRDGDDAAVSLTTPQVPAAGAAAPAPTESPAPAAAAAPASSPLPLRWRAIQLSNGEIDFTDNFIRPNYSARLTGVTGEVSALAWDDPKPAEVRITGEVDDSAPLRITGTIHPLGARLHTDIEASARGIDMTRLSTYAARYAGYGIEKGTLSARVHYRIAEDRLQADNQLYLDQLTFGEPVESPDALKIPVLLALALLKDRNGVIDINLPISGSLDDPQFSLGGLIVRMIVNLVVKAVTAPFALLAQAFGGGAEELGHIAFPAGAAAIDAGMKPALDTLAKALTERPALRLEITGRADPAPDLPALRRAHVERLLRAAKARATRLAVDEVRIEADERPRWIEVAYRAADIPGRPRNLLGLLQTLPAAEMEALLLQAAPVGPEQLKALADARADHVKAYLSQTVASERLLLTASRLDAAGIDDRGPTTRVAFALK